MKIVIEIAHQRKATVNVWEDDAFSKECYRQANLFDNCYCVWTPETAAESFETVPSELKALFDVGHKEVVEYGNYRTHFEPKSDAPSEQDFGWQHWIHDLHCGICFDSFSDAREWVETWKQRGGHQWITVKVALDRAEDQWS